MLENFTDVWSAGCVFIELFYGRTLLQSDSAHQLIQMIYNFVGPPTADQLREMKLGPEPVRFVRSTDGPTMQRLKRVGFLLSHFFIF